MMRLILNGEPCIYTHKCVVGDVKGSEMSPDTLQHFLVDTLYESFVQCSANVKKVSQEGWSYSDNAHGFINNLFNSSLKKSPDIIYKMDGDDRETWLFVMPRKEDVSRIDVKFVNKMVVKKNILPVLVAGDLWCFETDGQKNLCGSTFAAKYETISLLNEFNAVLPQILSQPQLIQKIAESWQKLDASIIEPYLDKDFHYTSDAVFYEMSSRHEYMDYIKAKFHRLEDHSNPIEIQIARIQGTDTAALLLHQSAFNQTLFISITTENGRITSMRMGEYAV
jgi:hypothetical protein